MSSNAIALRTAIPGPRSLALARDLRAHESRNVTFVSPQTPIFWESACGAGVVDVDGNRYLDLTAAFGVAAVGHAHPHVVEAIARQAAQLPHGMGDVYPTAVKVALMERLTALTGLDKVVLCVGGSEAVEVALKTAVLATGRPRVLAFEGAYHGLTLGALRVAGIAKFRLPFAALVEEPMLLPYGCDAAQVAGALERDPTIGAVIVEPLQGRGGERTPPPDFLRDLRAVTRTHDALLICDEIYTGFGRTGALFASLAAGAEPDLLCVGKAMAGGFPIAACLGSDAVMAAWPASTGEALHTSTYLGNPMACAAALATIEVIERDDLPARARALGERIATRLEPLRSLAHVREVRGRGAMWGVELDDPVRAVAATEEALRRGIIVLPSGPCGEVVSITPPLIIDAADLDAALTILIDVLREHAS
ncbi:aspartate aminotransferase family protein [bacterium]|nr:MAG: aspartate aminotransferase family protein [bacterium]